MLAPRRMPEQPGSPPSLLQLISSHPKYNYPSLRISPMTRLLLRSRSNSPAPRTPSLSLPVSHIHSDMIRGLRGCSAAMVWSAAVRHGAEFDAQRTAWSSPRDFIEHQRARELPAVLSKFLVPSPSPLATSLSEAPSEAPSGDVGVESVGAFGAEGETREFRTNAETLRLLALPGRRRRIRGQTPKVLGWRAACADGKVRRRGAC
eukprot:scaffold517_cov255-Pinguiococcus_pyrenoidosus.AAC.5